MATAMLMEIESTIKAPSAHGVDRPKRRRRACDQCTVSKTRCDGLEPFCTRCSKRGWPCNFSQRRRSGPKRKRDTPHLAVDVSDQGDGRTGVAAAVTPTDENDAATLSAWPLSRASFMLRGDSMASLRSHGPSPALLGAAPSYEEAAAGKFGLNFEYGMPGVPYQDQQQLPFFACGPSIVPDTSMGMPMPRMSMQMPPPSSPSPQRMAITPAHLELAALQADPRYLIHYMEMVNSFLPLAEPATLAEALATTPPPALPALVPDIGSAQDADMSETALVAADTMQARAAAQQALLWAAVGLGALYSGNDAFAARQMRKSRAYLQRCFDTAEPELVPIFLLHVVYHFYKVDVKKIQRYIGYAQQAARDASAGSLRPGVAASLRFMSALMHTSVTTAVTYDAAAPRAPEVLSRIGGPRRFLAIIEEVFFNMSLAYPPQGGGSYVDPSLPARLTRALQEADAVLEAAERPSMIAKACVQGLHCYFQLASGQPDLGLFAAQRMAKTVVEAPGALHFPPTFVLSRGASGVLQAYDSRSTGQALEAAMAPIRTKVVYANSVCSVGRELLRAMAPPPVVPPAVELHDGDSEDNAAAGTGDLLSDFEDGVGADFILDGNDYVDGGGGGGDDFIIGSGSGGNYDDSPGRRGSSTSTNYATDDTIVGFPGPSPSPSCDSVSSRWSGSGNGNVPASPAPQMLTPSPQPGPGREICMDRSTPVLASLAHSLSQEHGAHSHEILEWQRRLLKQQMSSKGVVPPPPQQQRQSPNGSSGSCGGILLQKGDGKSGQTATVPRTARAGSPQSQGQGQQQSLLQMQHEQMDFSQAQPAGDSRAELGGSSGGGCVSPPPPPALDQLTQDMLFDFCQEDNLLLAADNMPVIV